MTCTSTTTTSYTRVGTTTCEGCLDDIPTDEATDCGTHTYCDGCLTDSPCHACRDIRHAHDHDRADQAAYDAWRDREDHS